MTRQLTALIADTVRQAWSHKVFVGMFINGSLSLAVLLWYLRTISARGPYANLTLLANVDPRYLDNVFAAKVMLGSTVWFAFWTQIFFGLMLALGLLGAGLSAGRNAFLIATPVPRSLIFIGRFLGCLAVVTPGVLYPMAGIWIAARVWFGVWHVPFLAAVATTMLALTALLALMALAQTAFKSTAVALAFAAVLVFLNIGAAQPNVLRQLTGSDTLASLAGGLTMLLPQPTEIAKWTAAFVQSGVTGNSAALWSTALFSAIALTSGAFLFSRKEF